jgi:uncharacterized protein
MAAEATYLGTSAMTKLVVAEAESDALRAYLEPRSECVSSVIASVELRRALLARDAAFQSAGIEVLATIELIALEAEIIEVAASLPPASLRSLDAIHGLPRSGWASRSTRWSRTTGGCRTRARQLAFPGRPQPESRARQPMPRDQP